MKRILEHILDLLKPALIVLVGLGCFNFVLFITTGYSPILGYSADRKAQIEQQAKEVRKTKELLIEKAKNGDHSSQWLLAIEYKLGLGDVPKDLRLATYWYRKAAENGNISAQEELVDIYYAEDPSYQYSPPKEDSEEAIDAKTNAEIRNYAQAAYWGEKAAENIKKCQENNVHCSEYLDTGTMMTLVNIYSSGGYGLNVNKERAAYWLKEAAERGNVWAQEQLATAYAKGYDVPQDPIRAYIWYKRVLDSDSYPEEEKPYVKEKIDLAISAMTPIERKQLGLPKWSMYARYGTLATLVGLGLLWFRQKNKAKGS